MDNARSAAGSAFIDPPTSSCTRAISRVTGNPEMTAISSIPTTIATRGMKPCGGGPMNLIAKRQTSSTKPQTYAT